jgi:hypothetical protein
MKMQGVVPLHKFQEGGILCRGKNNKKTKQ